MSKNKKKINRYKMQVPFLINNNISYDYKCLFFENYKEVKKRDITYINMACSFDIETSSFYSNGKKCCCMYVFGVGVNGSVCLGRTWNDFIEIYNNLVSYYQLELNKKHLIIYVHNLSYEFQFIKSYLNFNNVFTVNGSVLYATTNEGVEFKCSYLLSNKKLEQIGNELHTYKVKKLVGSVNYDLIRTSDTPLTNDDINYIINDNLVVMAYIQECIDVEKSILKIPLTSTGYVRRYCRNMCYNGNVGTKHKNVNQYQKYRDIMQGLKIRSVEEYEQLKRAFMGGFTHANALHVGKTLNNVSSYDFTSDYPFQLVSKKYPMSSAEKISIKDREDFIFNIEHYACVFDVEFINIEMKSDVFDNPLSFSKCWNIKEYKLNNGRVVRAKCLTTTITNVDFSYLKDFYKWDKMRVANFRRYKWGYLPTAIIQAILKIYADKTQLKDVEGKEVEYLQAKALLNSIYGMFVEDIIKSVITYNNEAKCFINQELNNDDKIKQLEKYNNSLKRFTFYPWGLFCTAWARWSLFTGIKECGCDYIYSDTDSIKLLNRDKHINYFNKYNDLCIKQLNESMKYHKLDFSLCEPKTIEGVKKTLGVWDFEGTYDKFKTLGAKRYLIDTNDKLKLTCAGVSKKEGAKYLKLQHDPFESFSLGLVIPKENTGKLTHTYIDDYCEGYVYDYLGIKRHYKELSYIHLEKVEFSLQENADFLNYIEEINYKYEMRLYNNE